MPTKKKATAAKPGAPAKNAAAEAPKEKKIVPRAKHTDAYEMALRQFVEASDLLRRGSYASALPVFEAIRKENPDEPVLAARAKTYATVCARRLAPAEQTPSTPEGLYLAGVLCSNDGRFDEALACLDRAVEADPAAASYVYARSAARALAGHADGAASDLRQAIVLDARCRFQAANDPDFDKVRDEAVFIDVIEPTPDEA